MTTGWQLSAGTGFCEVGNDLVFLDLARDKYLALGGADRVAFDRLRRREANDSDAIGRLVSTGLIARSDQPTAIAPTRVDVPSADLVHLGEGRIDPRMTISAAFALRWARRAMRPDRIAFTVAELAKKKRVLGVPGAENAATRLAAAYAACRWLNPIPPRCLIDALALDRIMLGHGLAVSLVFGVRTSPFNAHCWLQTPETILTGSAAEARNFTSIMVVG
jgi:hypothetical protein